MPRTLAAVMCLFFAVPLLAHADQASKLAKAREYFELTRTAQISQQLMDQVTSQARGELLQELVGTKLDAAQQQVMDDLVKQIRAVLESTIGFSVLEPEYSKLVADLYTEEQLDQLVAFYRSPTGQALIEKTPLLLQQSNAVVQQRMGAVVPQIQQLVRQAMEQMLKSTPAPDSGAKKAPGN